MRHPPHRHTSTHAPPATPRPTSTHASGGDAMVTVLDGTGQFTVGGEVFILNEGDTLIMPKDVPHAVYGKERFKMQLVVSF